MESAHHHRVSIHAYYGLSERIGEACSAPDLFYVTRLRVHFGGLLAYSKALASGGIGLNYYREALASGAIGLSYYREALASTAIGL